MEKNQYMLMLLLWLLISYRRGPIGLLSQTGIFIRPNARPATTQR